MRITTVNAPEGFGGHGLRQIQMMNLGTLVVLVGRNGAGKSRLLELVAGLGTSHLAAEQLAQARSNLEERRALVAQNLPAHAKFMKQWGIEIDQGELQLATHEMISTDPSSETGPMVAIRLMPRPTNLRRAEQVLEDDRARAAENLARGDVQAAGTHALSYIRTIQDAYFNATHPQTSLGELERNQATSAHATLCDVIQQLLRTELRRDSLGRSLLFGFPPNLHNLSQGQNVLLQLAVLLHVRGVTLTDAVIFLDEPENHLHPKAVVEVVERLTDLVTNGQIWISTHSVHLLAEAYRHPSAIWYLEDGHVSFAGSTPERVLRGLLGDGEHRERLADLLTLPAAMATADFSADCLRTPAVADHKTGDKQTSQIAEKLHSLRGETTRPLRVVDYGAGRARLLSALVETFGAGDGCRAAFDYLAYEPNSALQAELSQRLSSVYGATDKRVFNTHDELDRLDDKTVDVAVLTNVLHEIDPRGWLKEIGPESVLSRKLAEKGYLLIVEDQRMPVGEKAHKLGFIVLNETATRKLFGVAEADLEFASSSRDDGRLTAFLVPARQLAKVCVESRRAALDAVLRHAKEGITRLRETKAEQSVTYRDGRHHALLLQQLANARLALDEDS